MQIEARLVLIRLRIIKFIEIKYRHFLLQVNTNVFNLNPLKNNKMFMKNKTIQNFKI